MLEQPRHGGVSLHIPADMRMNSLHAEGEPLLLSVSEVTLTDIPRPLNLCASALQSRPVSACCQLQPRLFSVR